MRSDTSLLSCSPPGLLIVHQTRLPQVWAQPSLRGEVPAGEKLRTSFKPYSNVTFSRRPCPPCLAHPGILSLLYYFLTHTPVSHMPYNLLSLCLLFVYCLPSLHALHEDDHVLVTNSSHVFSAVPGPADTQPRFEG